MSIDKQRIGKSFARHYGQYEDAAVVQRDMADRLAAALAEHAPQLAVQRALEIGIGTGFLTRHLATRFPDAEWWFNDLTPAAFDWIPVGLKQALTLEGDAETLPYPHGLDLLASASALQWFDDLEGFFPKAHSVMNAGGVLALASFGDRHFHELAAVANTPLHYPAPATIFTSKFNGHQNSLVCCKPIAAQDHNYLRNSSHNTMASPKSILFHHRADF